MYGLASCVLSATECQLPLCDSGKAALFSQARPFHGLPLTAALEVAEWEAVGKVHYQKGIWPPPNLQFNPFFKKINNGVVIFELIYGRFLISTIIILCYATSSPQPFHLTSLMSFLSCGNFSVCGVEPPPSVDSRLFVLLRKVFSIPKDIKVYLFFSQQFCKFSPLCLQSSVHSCIGNEMWLQFCTF